MRVATASNCPIDPNRDDRKTADVYEEHVTFKPGAAVVRDADGVKGILRSTDLLQDALDAAAFKRLTPD